MESVFEEEERKENSFVKILLGGIFFLVVLGLLISYWFMPWNSVQLIGRPSNFNFSLNSAGSNEMQFYPNLRYSSPNISYKIYDCSLQKSNEMEEAFEIISNISVLRFREVSSEEEISVNCDSSKKYEGGMFIAGEGGPANITRSGIFNVISLGKILLIEESSCPLPNVAIHELLHALGFEHSSNSGNIMYNFSNCRQTIGEDILERINQLYSVPSYPDLVLENASAVTKGRLLELNLSVRNNGLFKAGASKITVYSDGNVLKSVDLDPLEVGYGMQIFLSAWTPLISIEKVEIFIDGNFEELNKENNRLILE